VNAVLSATAGLALIFGVAQLVMPGPVLGIFGVKLDATAELFARAQGGAYLGYAIFNWMARASDLRAQRAAVLADLIVAVSGLVISVYSLAQGYGNALILVWIVAFGLFGAWQAWVLWGWGAGTARR
jgi:hypothetical protein